MTRPLDPAKLQDVVRRHTSARFARLDLLERHVLGTQYAGRPSWFDDSVPLTDREPCIVRTDTKNAIGSHVGMIFRHAPIVTSASDEDETEIDPTFGLDEAESKKLDAGIVQVMRHSNLLTVQKRMVRDAMSVGSAVAIPCVKNGRLAVDVTSSKWCEPKFSQVDGKVESLEIKYPFMQEAQDAVTGRWYKVVMLFRRVIDARSDTTFVPAEAPQRDGEEPVWRIENSVEHKLGFCPVVWYRFMGQCSAVREIDGAAIHAQLLDEIFALDVSVSQRHRSVVYNADPIIYECGVERGYSPTELGHSGAYMGPGDDPGNRQWGTRPQGNPQQQGRKRSPGRVWQYEDKEVKLGLLALPSDAVDAIQINVLDLEAMIQESLYWMPIDSKSAMSQTPPSGKALERMHKRQTDFCDDVRADFTEGALLPLVDMLLRLLVTMKARGVRIYLPGYDVLTDMLAKFASDTDGVAGAWMAPRLSVKWCDYFEPDEADNKARVELTLAAYEAGVIKVGTAVKVCANIFGIENPAQYADDIEADKEEQSESLAKAQQALADAAASQPTDDGEEPAVPAPRVGKPARPVRENGRRKKPPVKSASELN